MRHYSSSGAKGDGGEGEGDRGESERRSEVKIECCIEKGEPVVTQGNFLVMDGEVRVAAFALESGARRFVGSLDLLGACKDLLMALEDGRIEVYGFGHGGEMVCQRAEAAIAKVKGGKG